MFSALSLVNKTPHPDSLGLMSLVRSRRFGEYVDRVLRDGDLYWLVEENLARPEEQATIIRVVPRTIFTTEFIPYGDDNDEE